jgi:hypothetical protein
MYIKVIIDIPTLICHNTIGNALVCIVIAYTKKKEATDDEKREKKGGTVFSLCAVISFISFYAAGKKSAKM